MDFAFKTIAEFNDHFKDEKTCYKFLEEQRWSNGIGCPHCGSAKKPYNVKPRGKFKDIPSYRCSEKECDLPFTVRTGSIFEGSKVELRKWLQAAYELSISKKGISSVELGERIGVSQKTAWFINHRLRAMLKETAPQLLSGMVEADETYVGGKEKNKHKSKRTEGTQGRSVKTKTPVVGLLQRDGKVRTFVTKQVDAITVLPIIHENVEEQSKLYTDEASMYNGIESLYVRGVVKHGKDEYVKGEIHTNGIEGFWSLLKRGIIGTFHGVSPQHLQRYCDEFSHRYNNRNETHGTRFNDSVKRFDTARLKYRDLIASEL